MKTIKGVLIFCLLIILAGIVLIALYGIRAIEWMNLGLNWIKSNLNELEYLLNGFRGLIK